LLVVRAEFGSVLSPEDIPERMKFVVTGDIDSQDTPIPEAGGSQHPHRANISETGLVLLINEE
jgi:hypothetical protein